MSDTLTILFVIRGFQLSNFPNQIVQLLTFVAPEERPFRKKNIYPT